MVAFQLNTVHSLPNTQQLLVDIFQKELGIPLTLGETIDDQYVPFSLSDTWTSIVDQLQQNHCALVILKTTAFSLKGKNVDHIDSSAVNELYELLRAVSSAGNYRIHFVLRC